MKRLIDIVLLTFLTCFILNWRMSNTDRPPDISIGCSAYASNGYDDLISGRDIILPDYSTVPKKGQTIIEQTTGVPITRMTDIHDPTIDQPGLIIVYSRYTPLNTTGQYLLVHGEDSTSSWVYRVDDYAVIDKLRLNDTESIGEVNEIRWDYSGLHPTRVYFVADMKLYAMDVLNQDKTRSVIHDFSKDFPDGVQILNDVEGDSSADSRYWAFMVRGRYNGKEFPILRIITYDVESDKILGILKPSDVGKTKSLPRPNMVEISPKGTRVITHYGRCWAENRPEDIGTPLDGPHAWTLDFKNPVKIAVDETHSGWSFDMAGNEMFVSQNNRTDYTEARNIYTGETISIIAHQDMGWGNGFHYGKFYTSMNPGWIFISTYAETNDEWANNQLFMVEMKPANENPRVLRITPTYNTYDGDYRDEAAAALSFDGTQIFWTANWGKKLENGQREVFRTKLFKQDVDCIFDWIVREYPAYFQPSTAATTWSGGDLVFRYFSNSLAYLAAYFGTIPEFANNLLYLGPLTDNTIANLGPIDIWAGTCNCQEQSENLPKAATLISPSGTTGSTPTFSWNAVSKATSYYLWVNDSNKTCIKTWFTAAQAGCTSGTGTCTVTPGTSLPDGSYTWWIQAANEYGSGPWSKSMTFSISTSKSKLVQASDFIYLGAFRLPDGSNRPLTFEYGGGAMTYNPKGDPTGKSDGFPGSLFIMGHNRMPYGELPNGNQIAEVDIPVPSIQSKVASLNQSRFIQSFHNVDNGVFAVYDEIPRAGMAYLNHQTTGPKIHLSFGQHFQESTTPTHAWFDTNLSAPNLQGAWFIGNQSPYSTCDYLFEIPSEWSDVHAIGKYLATGRFRDGGWSGMGPALFAYCPWTDSAGTPALSDTRLQETTLLLYKSSEDTPNIENALQGYQHPDEWSGGQWITTSSGKSAVLFVGNKGVGDKYWYGYINPLGSQYPCVDAASVEYFTACRMANGQPCPSSDMIECEGHTSLRGWWASEWRAQIILYDPADLARVASGAIASWEPQPYTSFSIHDRMYLNPDQVDTEALGTGVQRRELIGDVAFDRANGLLYVLELFADGAKPVVHVWRVS